MSDAITLEDLRAALEGPEEARPVLVETLPTQYYRHTHLPGALSLPHDQVRELADQLLPDREAPVVVYCAGPT